MIAPTRYASRAEALSERFAPFNHRLDEISRDFLLPDHSEVNRTRYPWATSLRRPEFYASRLWEYPWALTESRLAPGLTCADIGCGQSPFTIFLCSDARCTVTGFDPEVGEAYTGNLCHGVPPDFSERSGVTIVPSAAEELDAPDDSFDRVYCISVIEHIPKRTARARGMREIARVLRPGGLALITVDVNLKKRIVNPLELVWESGLDLCGEVDLVMPTERFGIFNDGLQPADVFGFVLRKPETLIATEYGQRPSIEAWRASSLRDTFSPEWPDEDVPRVDQAPPLSS